ncbi:MAG TPA: VIT domain-containing protein [Thermotogota bacterium]|nr:VIT domain-containing protein [Thermotogota bacterium]
MNRKMLFLVVLCLLPFLSLFADGVILPDPFVHVTSEMGWTMNPIRMIDHNVDIEVHGDVASVSIAETFLNTLPMTVEVIYLFPVPKGAMISDFKMKVGDQEYSGEVLDSAQARQVYQDYVRMQKDPALLEYVDQELVRLTLAPFLPGETRSVSLTYTQVLEKTGNVLKLAYPLKIDALHDAPISTVRISGTIQSNEAIYQVYSPTHAISSSIDGTQKMASFQFSADAYLPTSDLVVFFNLGEREVEAYMVPHFDPEGLNSYMLDILPELNFGQSVPKNVVLVLDQSGSMSGTKFYQAREAAKFVINRLGKDDHFNIILFDDQVSAFKLPSEGVVDVSYVPEAISWLNRFDADGMTNIYDALDTALKKMIARAPGSNHYLLFLTDGLPTEGIQDENRIVANARTLAQKTKNVRIFTFGVGYDVNTYILDLLADQTGGLAFYVTENENIESTIARLYNQISRPVLTDVEISMEGEGLQFFDPVPSKNLVLYQDQPLKIFGRFLGEGVVTVHIRGKLGDGEYENTFTFNLSPSHNPYIATLWAGRRINELLNLYKLEGPSPELEDQIIHLSKLFGIPTPLTSYVVAQDVQMDDASGVASAPRSTVSTNGVSLKLSTVPPGTTGTSQAAPAAPMFYGKSAVTQSQNQNVMAQSMTMEEYTEAQKELEGAYGGGARSKMLKGKVFLFDENENSWVDEEFEENDVQEVENFSDEYFALMDEFPNLSEWIQLGDKIKIQLDGVNYIFE